MSDAPSRTTQQKKLSPPKDTPLWRIGPPVVILVMLGVIVYALMAANTGDTSNDLANRFPEVERVFPFPDSEVLRQSRVGVDLIPGWGAELHINGTAIPPDQVNVLGNPDFDGSAPEQRETLDVVNRYEYQPLGGRAVEALNGDTNCVRAEIFPLEDPSAIKNVEWCFTAA